MKLCSWCFNPVYATSVCLEMGFDGGPGHKLLVAEMCLDCIEKVRGVVARAVESVKPVNVDWGKHRKTLDDALRKIMDDMEKERKP